MYVYSAMLSASLVERRFAYSATCSVRLMLVVVRLVMPERCSAVACARLANTTDISVTVFAVPVWYSPC